MEERIAEGFPGQRIRVLPRPLVRAALRTSPTSSILATDVGFFPRAAHHWRTRPGLEELIVIHCVAGAGQCRVAGRTHQVGAGDVLVVPPRTPHQYQADERQPWSIWWAHVAGTDVPALTAAIGASPDAPVFRVAETAKVSSLLDTMLRRMEADESQRTLVAASGAAWHLLALLAADRRPFGHPRVDPISEVRDYLRANLAERISVSELAAMTGFSVSHFSALFRRATGFGAVEYQTRLRMSAARQLLDTTDLTVGVIARQVGYDDSMYFSRRFRSIHQASPTQYRNRGVTPP